MVMEADLAMHRDALRWNSRRVNDVSAFDPCTQERQRVSLAREPQLVRRDEASKPIAIGVAENRSVEFHDVPPPLGDLVAPYIR
jgi:hypothetical protein